jgi:hypothetical protein
LFESPFRRHTWGELLELRLALDVQGVFGDLLAPATHPFPDGLGYADPLVRAAVAGVTTSARGDEFIFVEDFLTGSTPAETEQPSVALVESGDLVGLPDFRDDARFAGVDG